MIEASGYFSAGPKFGPTLVEEELGFPPEEQTYFQDGVAEEPNDNARSLVDENFRVIPLPLFPRHQERRPNKILIPLHSPFAACNMPDSPEIVLAFLDQNLGQLIQAPPQNSAGESSEG